MDGVTWIQTAQAAEVYLFPKSVHAGQGAVGRKLHEVESIATEMAAYMRELNMRYRRRSRGGLGRLCLDEVQGDALTIVDMTLPASA